MAKEYQRHARGGGFKHVDVSDGGLRAFKEQQQTIIDAQKLQKAQFEQTRGEYLRASKGVAEEEEKNRLELLKLGDKIYKTKRGALETRKRTEIDYWKGKELEYKKREAFWSKFSTTYSKQWGQLAQGVVDHVQMNEARAVHDELRKAGVFDILQGQNSEWENLGIFDPLAKESSNIVNNRKALSEKKQKDLAYIESLIERTNRFSANLIAKELGNNKSGLSDFIVRKYLTEKKITATASSINEAHRTALTEFLDSWNIKPGDGHRAISNIFHQSGNLYAKGFATQDLHRTNEQILLNNNKEFMSIPSSAVDREKQMMDVYQRSINNHHALKTSENPNGMTKKAAMEKVALSILPYFGDLDEWNAFIKKSGIVGSGGDDKTIPSSRDKMFTNTEKGIAANERETVDLLRKGAAIQAEEVRLSQEFTRNKGIKELQS